MRQSTVLEMRLLLGLAVLFGTLAPTVGLAYDFQIIAQPGDVIEGRTITRFSLRTTRLRSITRVK